VCNFSVDDEYIIIGSANINQRSMAGNRDSEMAMGAYQPHQLSVNQPSRGDIHGFRMSLWYEHSGTLDNAYLQPSTVNCIRLLKAIGDKNWAVWSGDAVVNMPGQLLSYPVVIGQDGSISNVPGFECFPESQGKIMGTKSDTLPSILTC
jgi:phospholipase D1/2